MTSAPEIPVPRAAYGAGMLAASVAAAGLSWAVAAWLGGDSFTVRTVLIASAVGLVATLAPAVLRVGRDHWGVAVMGAGVARMLLSLGFCYAVREASPEVLARPLFVGVVAGAMLLLVVEATAAIRVLAALERRREMAARPAAEPNRKLA